VRPFINLTAALTINGGLLMSPEIRLAMDEAARYSVNIDELMDKVGERLATLVGCEAAIVTAGCAAALTLATAAAVAGADPENIQQLPDLTGLKTEVIMPRQSRNVYDHAIRMLGVTIVTVDTPADFHLALNNRTAMVCVLGDAEKAGAIRLEEMAQAAHKLGVPLLVDAAAEIPAKPDPYLSRGADLVAYSGGKFLGGPQCAGMLLGRKDLIRAAWLNGAPHHAFGRSMKVGKEEIIGLLAAVEYLMTRRDVAADRRLWESWLTSIAETINRIPGVRTQLLPPPGTNPHPFLRVEWDRHAVGLTASEVGRLLLESEPRIMTHATGDGHFFLIRAACMKPGDDKIVARRLAEVFRTAPLGRQPKPPAPPVVDVSGRWDMDITFARGATRHTLFLHADRSRITGLHLGRVLKGDLRGTIDGERIELSSTVAHEGTSLRYAFRGSASGERMEGDVDLGEYGRADWTARRHVFRGASQGD
jgi:L-seryl-tRNA(Ser) seleniumtransferase